MVSFSFHKITPLTTKRSELHMPLPPLKRTLNNRTKLALRLAFSATRLVCKLYNNWTWGRLKMQNTFQACDYLKIVRTYTRTYTSIDNRRSSTDESARQRRRWLGWELILHRQTSRTLADTTCKIGGHNYIVKHLLQSQSHIVIHDVVNNADNDDHDEIEDGGGKWWWWWRWRP